MVAQCANTASVISANVVCQVLNVTFSDGSIVTDYVLALLMSQTTADTQVRDVH